MLLGNIYRRTMPVSLARVAAAVERATDIRVDVLDLKARDPARETEYKRVDLGDRMAIVNRIGASFDIAADAIRRSDIIGLSNHFTYESGVIRDLISFARRVRPDVRIIVGGADAKARPQFYLDVGADLVFRGDVSPEELVSNDWSVKRIVGDYRHPFSEMSRPAFDKLQPVSQYSDSHDGPVPDGVGTPVGFIHFTRGCPRECDFCESRRTKFEALPLADALAMINHYASFGIRTLNFADDNLLLLKRDYLQALFAALRERGFAW
ncbi:cobalamin-dependent protein [Salinarimonas rosea]|uniref:cobalamin-dependent protein n=1 Tax=Salinarimonas rosea TaxID=552063 RepID=UPI00146F97B5|nr:cobalamin-dependent protein [Salinarimonas rosea]